MKTEKCPSCKVELNMSTPVDGSKRKPVPGDISVCFYCGAFMMFDKNVHRTKMTKKQFEKLEPELQAQMIQAQNMIKIQKSVKIWMEGYS